MTQQAEAEAAAAAQAQAEVEAAALAQAQAQAAAQASAPSFRSGGSVAAPLVGSEADLSVGTLCFLSLGRSLGR